MTDPQRLEKAEQGYKLMSMMQYVLPLFMVVLAVFLPVLADLGQSRDMIVGVLFVFALMDFFLLKLLVLPKMQRDLERLRSGE